MLNSPTTYLIVFAFSCSVAVGFAAQQKEFQPIPPHLKDQYRINFHNFFRSPEAEVQERKIIERNLNQLEAMKQSIAASGKQLSEAFELLEKIRFQFRKHDLYLFFRFATNMKDEAAQKAASDLRVLTVRAREMVEQAVLSTPEKRLKQLFYEEPKLEKYRFAVEAIQRRRPFTLPVDQEKILSEIRPLANGDFYYKTVNDLQFGKIKTPEGKTLDVVQQGREIANHPDPGVRSEGRKKLFGTYATKRDVFALGLIQLIQLQNKLSQLHRFKNFRDEFYFEEYLSGSEVENLYDEIAKNGQFYRRFEKIKANQPSARAQTPRFSIVEATAIIKKAMTPLSDEYAEQLSSLLDPKNGRLDIVPGENRLPMQGGASVYPIGISTFFAFSYEGYYIDVMLVAHEAGHAVQAMLMSSNNVPMAYAAGPGYFTESFGRFNEFMVADFFYQNEADPQRKQYYMREFSERAFALFPSVIEAAVESAIHQGVEQGQIHGANDLDRITQSTGSKYSDSFKTEEERKMLWMDAPEYYVAPLHKMHNVYASVLALKYYEMYRRNPKDFVPRYMALLKNGYNASPDVLLKKYLGIDFRDPGLVGDAISFLEDRLSQLR